MRRGLKKDTYSESHKHTETKVWRISEIESYSNIVRIRIGEHYDNHDHTAHDR